VPDGATLSGDSRLRGFVSRPDCRRREDAPSREIVEASSLGGPSSADGGQGAPRLAWPNGHDRTAVYTTFPGRPRIARVRARLGG